MKKKPFLLLEVLIALSLVAVCAVPLVQQPLRFYRAEIRSFEQMEKERLAEWTFTEIKEKLLKNEIPWEKIPAKNVASHSFTLPTATLSIPGCKPKTIERSFILKGKGEKIGLKEEIYRSISIDILLDQSHYLFRLPVQKIKNVEKKENSTHSEDIHS